MNFELTVGQKAAMDMVARFMKARPPMPALLTGFAGCHRKGQLVLLANGRTAKVEDVKVGDRLMGPDSKPRSVLWLCRNRGRMVQVEPIKGPSWVVNEDHILTLHLGAPWKQHIVDISVRDFLNWPRSKRAASKLFRVGVEFPEIPSGSLDPYFVGALLGDGALAEKGSVGLSKPDSFIRDLAHEQAAIHGLTVNPSTDDSSVTWRIVGGEGDRESHRQKLNVLGLNGIAVQDKFIPDQYRLGSFDTRRHVLAGLIDTDGHLDRSGVIDFISVSARLSNDLVFVARSLGLAAYLTECQKKCQTGTIGRYYRVCISGDLSILPCRRLEVRARRQKKSVLRTGFLIRDLGVEEDYYGFMLDGDHRYLLDDFTVTHNTGKTTMIKGLASLYGEPIVLAPTGKAAVRVQEATGLKASTIHRWLYVPKEDPETGEVKYRLKEWNQIEIPYNRLIIVDEASMVGRDVWEHLWDRCQINELRILLVGDPFQLAPVEVNRGRDQEYIPFNILADVETEFRAHLDEVTRQALDNPILKASMLLRETSRIDQAIGLLPRVFGKNFNDKCMEVYRDGGAIIVHKNDTRHKVNGVIRERLGYGPEIQVGEPLLVLRNTYEIDRFNGEVIKFNNWINYDQMPKAVRDRWRNTSLMLTFGYAKVDDGKEVMLSPEQVRGEAAAMTESVIGRTSKAYYGDTYHDPNKPLYAEGEDGRAGEYLGPPHLHCNFGYALTCHKSQGSEWSQVLVLIENSVRAASYEGRRWVYTALTRGKEKCFISMEV